MSSAEIKRLFDQNRENFNKAYPEISGILATQLKIPVGYSGEDPTKSRIQFNIHREDRRVILNLYYNGRVYIHLQKKLSSEQKNLLQTPGDYAEIEDDKGANFCDLDFATGLDNLVKRIKEFMEQP